MTDARKPDEPTKKEAGKDTVLQRTQDGYVETSVDEIPLSDAAGEGRLRRQPDDHEG